MTATQTDPTRPARPSDLLRETAQNGWPHGPVALDTETSGLFPDSGARVSTVSVAWRTLGEHDGDTVSLAWPFNQGIEGKVPTGTGIQDSLFGRDADHNLPPQEWVALCQWLQIVGAGGSGLVFHNALFDLTLMNAGVDREGMHGVDLTPCLAWDTQLTAGLIWPMHVDSKTGRRDHSLKGLSKTLYGEAEGDEQKVIQTYLRKNKLESGRWDLMPWDVIERYAAKDAELTIRMYYDQVAAIDNGAAEWIGDADDVHQLLAEDRRVCVALARMEWRGLPYDQAESRRVARELRTRQQAIELPFAPSSNAAKRYFFEEQGHEPPARTAKGAPSLTAEGVDVLVARGIEEAKLWRDWNKAETARKMWYNGYAEMVGPGGRLRTRFRQTGTRSGRFSCERVNLQAIPQDYRLSDARVLEGLPTPRAVIRAEVEKNYPGWSTWELDLAQAELRVAAARAKCALMLTLIGEGADLHGETAKELFQATPEDKGWFAYRQVAKRANFSLIFGSGAETFAGMVRKEVGWEMTKHEADRLVRQWNALYPEFHRTIDVCSEQVFLRQKRAKAVTARLQSQAGGAGGAALGLDQGPWIATWGGRRKWFYGGDDFHKAFNQNVQGALAVLASKWLLAADEVIRGYDVQYKADLDGIGGAGLLLVVHDSLVMLLPDEQADAITRDVRQAGLDVWAELFPEVPGDIDVGRFGVK